jgi:hypothetical protein
MEDDGILFWDFIAFLFLRLLFKDFLIAENLSQAGLFSMNKKNKEGAPWWIVK